MKHVPFKLNKYSCLAEVETSFCPGEIEAALNKASMTAGIIEFEDQLAFSSYLAGERSLEPFLKFGDIHDLVAALEVELDNGDHARTFLTPRSAAGPNLRYLLSGHHHRGPKVLKATLRVQKLPETVLRKAVLMEYLDEAITVVRDQIQSKNRPQQLRIYSPEILTKNLGDRNNKYLLVYEYSGETLDSRFRFERMTKAVESYSFENIEDISELKKFNDEKRSLPVFGDLLPEQSPEVVIHLSVVWSKIVPLLQKLARISGGIYPVRTTISGAWHEAALLSVRLFSFEGERDRSLIAKEVNDLLELFTEFRTGILEITPSGGRIDKKWDTIFNDPLSERLFKS